MGEGGLGDTVAALREGASLAAAGGFTIDREKAREKLRAYQFAAPYEYVLLLVESAILRGATRIDVTTDADDVRFAFDAEYSGAELEQLYGSIFAEGGDPRTRSLQELALAVNAATAMGPRFVRIDSGGGLGDGARLELRPGHADRLEARGNLAPGTRIHVRERLGLASVWEFLRALTDGGEEAKALRERCRLARLPITLNGAAISRGLADGLCGVVELAAPGLVGVVGWRRSAEGADEDAAQDDPPAEVDVLSNGVWMEREALPGACARLCARIDATSLRKDLSQRALVRDASYEAALVAVREAELAAIDRLAAAIRAREAWAAGRLPEVLADWLFADAGGLGLAALEAQAPSVLALRCWPVFTAKGASQGAPRGTAGGLRTLAELAVESGSIHVFADVDEPRLPEGIAWAVDGRGGSRIITRLGELFGERVVDLSDAIRRLGLAEAGERAFRERPHAEALPPVGSYYARAPIRYAGVRGEVGIRRHGRERSELRIVVDGCLLRTFEVDLPLPGVQATIAGDFTANDVYGDVVADDALLRGLIAAAVALEAAIDELPAGGRRRWFARHLLDWGACGDHIVDLARASGFATAGLRGRIAALLGGQALLDSGRRWIAEGHVCAEVGIAEDASGRERSLGDLAALAESRGRVDWLAKDELRRSLRPPAHVVVLEPRRIPRLTSILGGVELRSFAPEFAQMAEERAFMARPVELVTRSREALVYVERTLAEHDLRGVIEVVAPAAGWSEHAEIRVLRKRRALDRRTIRLPIVGVAAVFNGNALPLGGGEGLADPAIWRAIEGAVRGSLAALIRGAIDEYAVTSSAREGDYRLFLLYVCRRLIGPWPRLGAFARLHAAGRGDAWHGLIDVEVERGAAAVAEALAALLERGELPTRGAIEALLGARPAPQFAARDPHARVLAELRHALADGLAGLLGKVLLSTREGGPRTLLSLATDAADGEAIAWVPASHGRGDAYGEGGLLLLDRRERVALAELVGGLVDRENWLLGQIVREGLESRPRLERLDVAPGHVFTAVDVDDPEGRLRGTIGLSRRASSTVLVCCRRRPIVTLNPALSLPIEAVIDGDSLELQVDLNGISGAEVAAVEALCRRHLPRLVAALYGRWEALAAADRREVSLLLAGVGAALFEPPSSAGRLRLPADPQRRALAEALAEVPILTTLAGEARSIAELLRREVQAELFFVRWEWLGELPAEEVILARDEVEVRLLERVDPEVRDFFEVWNLRHAQLQRLAGAGAMPAGPPSTASAAVAIDVEGLEGWLWAAPPPATIAVGWRGKAVCDLALTGFDGLHGAVAGPGVALSPELDAVESLASEAQRALMDARERLLLELGEIYARALAAGDYAPPGLRALLAAQLLARVPRVVAGDEPETPALRRVAALPVLQVGSGLVSLEAARRERPLGLRSLGLWRDAPLDVEVVVVDEPAEDPEASAEEAAGVSAEEGAEEASAEEASAEEAAEAELLAAIDGELRRIWAGAPELFRDEHLDWIAVGPTVEGALVEHRDGALWVNPRHPVVASLRAAPTIPAVALGVVVSAVYSALNHGEEAIVDDHEVAFHRLHAAALVASLCADGPAAAAEARGPGDVAT